MAGSMGKLLALCSVLRRQVFDPVQIAHAHLAIGPETEQRDAGVVVVVEDPVARRRLQQRGQQRTDERAVADHRDALIGGGPLAKLGGDPGRAGLALGPRLVPARPPADIGDRLWHIVVGELCQELGPGDTGVATDAAIAAVVQPDAAVLVDVHPDLWRQVQHPADRLCGVQRAPHRAAVQLGDAVIVRGRSIVLARWEFPISDRFVRPAVGQPQLHAPHVPDQRHPVGGDLQRPDHRRADPAGAAWRGLSAGTGRATAARQSVDLWRGRADRAVRRHQAD